MLWSLCWVLEEPVVIDLVQLDLRQVLVQIPRLESASARITEGLAVTHLRRQSIVLDLLGNPLVLCHSLLVLELLEFVCEMPDCALLVRRVRVDLVNRVVDLPLGLVGSIALRRAH